MESFHSGRSRLESRLLNRDLPMPESEAVLCTPFWGCIWRKECSQGVRSEKRSTRSWLEYVPMPTVAFDLKNLFVSLHFRRNWRLCPSVEKSVTVLVMCRQFMTGPPSQQRSKLLKKFKIHKTVGVKALTWRQTIIEAYQKSTLNERATNVY